jgi:protein-S-isoprenylcysteine O-methyltransferase Ste14
MGILEYLVALAASAPAIALWIAVIIYGAVKLNRGGGRAERFLIAGGSVKLLSNLLGVANLFFLPWLFNYNVSVDDITTYNIGYSVFRSIVSMAGILCLLYAFWVKFKAKREVEIPS